MNAAQGPAVLLLNMLVWLFAISKAYAPPALAARFAAIEALRPSRAAGAGAGRDLPT